MWISSFQAFLHLLQQILDFVLDLLFEGLADLWAKDGTPVNNGTDTMVDTFLSIPLRNLNASLLRPQIAPLRYLNLSFSHFQ